jgi:hypothetical protein
MLKATIAQPLQDWLLCALGFLQQRLMDELALFCFGGQTGCTAQVGLIS